MRPIQEASNAIDVHQILSKFPICILATQKKEAKQQKHSLL